MPLVDWVSEFWTPLVGYAPEVVFLTKGWFGFRFRKAEDSTLILEKLWVYGGGSLMLKHWRVSFDPALDYFRHQAFMGVTTRVTAPFVECEGFGSHWKHTG
jgi:hypothetical protein